MDYTFYKLINWRRCLTIIKYIYTPLVLLCILSFILENRSLLSDLFIDTNIKFMISAIFSWATLHFLAPLLAYFFFKAKNCSLQYTNLLDIYIARLPAKYLPGGIWHTVARMHDYHVQGMSKTNISHLALFETIFPIPFTFFTGLILLSIETLLPLPQYLVSFFLFSSAVFLILPFVFSRIMWPESNNSRAYYFFLILLSVFFWLIASLSFFLYLHSFPLTGANQYSFLTVSGAYIFSWGTGYISLFAPQGIGVFEVVMANIINLPINLGSSVAFLAGFRLVALIADFIIFFIYKLLRSSSKYNGTL